MEREALEAGGYNPEAWVRAYMDNVEDTTTELARTAYTDTEAVIDRFGLNAED